MNSRFLFALCALSLATTVAACGSDDEAPAKTTTFQLTGVYRPVDQGPIGSVTFTGAKDYLLMPKGCAGGGCAEIGTYRLDTASKLLVLENGTTHETRSINFEILETTPAGGALVKSIRPLDLVDPGEQLTRPGGETTNGQQQVTGNQQQLAQSSGGITGAVTQLLQTIIQAMMNGQQMKQDDQNKNADPKADPKADPPKNDPNVDCKQGIPNKDTPLAEVAAYFARCPAGP